MRLTSFRTGVLAHDFKDIDKRTGQITMFIPQGTPVFDLADRGAHGEEANTKSAAWDPTCESAAFTFINNKQKKAQALLVPAADVLFYDIDMP